CSAKHEEDSDRPAQVGTPSILDNEHIYSKADTRNKARKIAGFVSNLKSLFRGSFLRVFHSIYLLFPHITV
ncbi:MAG: hypothetical protein IKH31_08900, partial [Clostridia bacterium]|nr:hypothetical protein [Clostridia bacterium]